MVHWCTNGLTLGHLHNLSGLSLVALTMVPGENGITPLCRYIMQGRRGNFHTQKYPYPWLPSIPVIALQYGDVTRSRRASACDDPSPPYDPVRRVDGHEHLTQGQCNCKRLNWYFDRVMRVHRRVFTRLLSIPTPRRKASRQASNREVSGVSGLGSRRVVPTGRLTVQGLV